MTSQPTTPFIEDHPLHCRVPSTGTPMLVVSGESFRGIGRIFRTGGGGGGGGGLIMGPLARNDSINAAESISWGVWGGAL